MNLYFVISHICLIWIIGCVCSINIFRPLDERNISVNGLPSLQIHKSNLGIANNAISLSLPEGTGDRLKRESNDFYNDDEDGHDTSDEEEHDKVLLFYNTIL